MQYYGQLNDLEVVRAAPAIEEPEHVEALIAAFEDAYAQALRARARSPELGYLVTQAIVKGSVPVEKPALPERRAERRRGPPEGDPPGVVADGFADTAIYEMDDVRPGHTLAGPAIVESPADTFAIPPGRSARLDANRIFHLERGG